MVVLLWPELLVDQLQEIRVPIEVVLARVLDLVRDSRLALGVLLAIFLQQERARQ